MRNRWNNPARQRLWMQVFLWGVLGVTVALAAAVQRVRLNETTLPLSAPVEVRSAKIPGIRLQLPEGWTRTSTMGATGEIQAISQGQVPRKLLIQWAHFDQTVDPMSLLLEWLPDEYHQRMTMESQRDEPARLKINGQPAAMVTGLRKVPELSLQADMIYYDVYLCISMPSGDGVRVYLSSPIGPRETTDLVGLATVRAVAASIEILPPTGKE